VTNGAACPEAKPFGATSNPDHRVTDATQNYAPASSSNRYFVLLVNDPG
jgi:hypothetical protein